MFNHPCPATLWVGNEKIQCNRPIVGTGPILDEITGECAGPFRHFIGNNDHEGYVGNIFYDESGNKMWVSVKWTQYY